MEQVTRTIICDNCRAGITGEPFAVITHSGIHKHYCSAVCLSGHFRMSKTHVEPVKAPAPAYNYASTITLLDTKAAARYLGVASATIGSATTRRRLIPTEKKMVDGRFKCLFSIESLDAYKASKHQGVVLSPTPKPAPKPQAPAVPASPAVPAQQVLGYKTLSDGRPLFNEEQAAQYLGFKKQDTVRAYVQNKRLSCALSEPRKPGAKIVAYYFLPSALEAFKLDIKSRCRARGLKAHATACARGTARIPSKGVPSGVTGFGTEEKPVGNGLD